MERQKSPEINKPIKVDSYKGYDVYTWADVPREAVASMSPNSLGKPSTIIIHPDAYEILKHRPDYLERIFDHELQHEIGRRVKHGYNHDILEFLRDKGYNFGN